MGIIDVFFPRKCFGCGKEGEYICLSCFSKLRKPIPICPECERPSVTGKTHKGCKKDLGLDGLSSIWFYEGPVRKAIISLKYKFALDIAKELSKKAVLELKEVNLRKIIILVPIPSQRRRENWRGFNQAEELGKLISRKMGWEFIPGLLVKKAPTPPQTQLSRRERRKNVKGAFSLNPFYKNAVTRNKFILFDDVWTTGATIKEAVKTLKINGANEVWGLTLVRGR